MYYDKDEHEWVIPLKGKPAVLVIVFMVVWFIFASYYSTRKANMDHTGAAESIKVYLQSNGVRQVLPDGAEGFDVDDSESVDALIEVVRVQVNVIAIRGGVMGRKVVKAEIIEKGQRRAVFYKIRFHSLTNFWDPMTIYETNETAFNFCLWRSGG